MQISMTPNNNKRQLQQPSTMASTNTINMNIPASPTTPNRIIKSIVPKPKVNNPISQVHQQIAQAQNVIPQTNIIKPSINQTNGMQAIQAPQVHYAMPSSAKGNSLGFNAGLLNSVLKNIATRQNANYIQYAQNAQANRMAQHNDLLSRLASLQQENSLNNKTRMTIADKNLALKNQQGNLNYDLQLQRLNTKANMPLTPYQTAMIKQRRLQNATKGMMASYSPEEISAINNNPQIKEQIIQHYVNTGTLPKLNYTSHFFGSGDVSIANSTQPTTQQPQQPQGTLEITQLPLQQQYQIFKQQQQQQGNQTI